MRLLVSVIVLFMILFLLGLSLKKQSGENISEADMAGAAFIDEGVSLTPETQSQMQTRANVGESQQEGTTVLDFAAQSAKAEIKKWEESSALFINNLWEEAKESAFLMAADTAELIYPTKPLKLKQSKTKQSQLQAGRQ